MKKELLFTRFLICFVLFCPAPLPAEDLVLYNSTLGSLPAEQPWLSYFSQGTANEQPMAEGVRLTTAENDQAGYSDYTAIPQVLKNTDFPVLDRSKGISLLFELQVHSETHLAYDRGGFSLILLADDNKGVEIGFWEGEIWAQTDTPELFTHGEGIDFDTTDSLKLYTLSLTGDSYSLYQDGILLLTGSVKDYSAFSGNPLFNPYQLSNFLFFGDNTTSAGSDITLGKVVVQTDALLQPDFPWPMFLPAMTGTQ